MKARKKIIVAAVIALTGGVVMTSASANTADELVWPMDQTDISAIKSLSSTELAKLNLKLRRAMALYYDNSYQLALPLFQQIAASIETQDVLYWLGKTAYQTGRTDLAIEKYLELLERNPDFHRVRLDLAIAYLQIGDADAAKRELDMVLQSDPPESLRKQIKQVLGNVGGDRRFYAFFRGSVGTMYDENITAQPDGHRVTQNSKFWGIPLSFAINENSGVSTVTKGNLDLLWDFGQPNGWVWHTKVNYGQYIYDTYGEYNYAQSDVSTALNLFSERFTLKLPYGWIKRWYNRLEQLSTVNYFAPEFEIEVINNLKLYTAVRYDNEVFDKPQRGQSNAQWHVDFGPKYDFGSKNDPMILSLLADYTDKSTRFKPFGYEEWGVGVSFFQKLPYDIDAFYRVAYHDRDYDAFTTLIADKRRRDERYDVNAVFSKAFGKYYFTTTTVGYTNNNSNTPLTRYDKYTVGLNLGVNLDLFDL